MKHEFAPARLNVHAFAVSSSQLAGQEALASYPRLVRECAGRQADRPVLWSAHGEVRGDQPQTRQDWLHLHADALVPLTCQRCLEAVQVRLLVDRWFRFVADEETAAAQDDDCEEDLLVLETDFDLLALIEDELVLELPMIARHEVCPAQSSKPATDTEFGTAVAGRPNPFAALAHRLKPGGGGQSE